MVCCKKTAIMQLTHVLFISGLWFVAVSGFKTAAIANAKAFLKSEDFKSGVPDFTANLGAISDVATIDYSKPPMEVFKSVGDAVLPLITTGLALIPGGAIISGVVSAVWGLMGPLFGGPPQKSPIELLSESINKEIGKLREEIQKSASETLKAAQQHTRATVSRLVTQAVHGEMSRNKYICNKYALISKDFSDDLKYNRPINESLRIQMLAYIMDCDNFLKDTSTAFLDTDYADALWIPSAISTLVRVSFLTETTNYGTSLQMEESLVVELWEQLKKEITKQLSFYGAAIALRVGQKLKHLVRNEDEACEIQKQLLYFDRDMYPYGVPEQVVKTCKDEEINIADYNVTESDKPVHIQIFAHNAPTRDGPDIPIYLPMAIFNCMIGPTLLRTCGNEFSFRIKYVVKKSYQLRIIYFRKEGKLAGSKLTKFNTPKTLNMIQEGPTSLKFNIIERNEYSGFEQFIFKTRYQTVMCKSDKETWNPVSDCDLLPLSPYGAIIVETFAIFDVLTNEDTIGKIEFDLEKRTLDPQIEVLGLELIILGDLSTNVVVV